jgi:GNAT superfamily N-acetyltransferase
MAAAEFSITPLHTTHQRAGFKTSHHPQLAEYLRKQASQDVRRRLARVFCLTAAGETAVLGYYTLSAASVEPGHLPDAARRGLPSRLAIPAVLLGRLAVDATAEGRGIGRLLLSDAILRVQAQRDIGIHALLIDAKDLIAAAFYLRFGFQAFPSSPLRLFLPLRGA